VRLLRLLLSDPVEARQRIRIRARMTQLRLVNRASRKSVLGDGPVVVNLTTFGHRLATVHYALESIAAGTVRPRRMILWLDEPPALSTPTPELTRLQRRGLEIRHCQNWGPHKKQYPYALLDRPDLPLAAADDDVLYPRSWLAGLLGSYRAYPDSISGYRARTITVEDAGMGSYASWDPRTSDQPSFAAICIGVSGIIYPPVLLDALRDEGEEFMVQAPRADDIWVHAVAVRHGIRTRQVHDTQTEFPAIPGTQIGTLYRQNVTLGGNDEQIARTHSAAVTELIIADHRHGG
jgi:hypothetical protein